MHIEKEIEEQYTPQTKKNLEQRWYNIKPVLGVASGGVYPGIVPKMLKAMGNDIVIQAGGGVHGHPDGTIKGAMAMRQAIDAYMKGKKLREYAKSHEELKKALENWGE